MSRRDSEGGRVTDWLARHLLGPAQVGDGREPVRPASADERARERELRTSLVRVQDASGRTYLVERSDADTQEPS
ncbi:hypothetical protein [Cellulomonas persica]|uniref:Uncharacterized protein n=1 Tax=Cellulomonas persica TaxID=76861 RepID=A0A510UQU6_9CELL|nr:hypothetical protein [Cellulomonas persica]GEK17037.1 hypothetical protein CPE01_07700 [Cellulomonas persica]